MLTFTARLTPVDATHTKIDIDVSQRTRGLRRQSDILAPCGQATSSSGGGRADYVDIGGTTVQRQASAA
jgi:hypothetical protein